MSVGRRLRRRTRAFIAGVAPITLTAGMAMAASPAQAAVSDQQPADEPGPADEIGSGEVEEKIQPNLVEAFESESRTDFWVRLGERPDFGAARQITDWTERGTAVAAGLKEAAESSQGDVLDTLEQAGIDHEAFWITNAVYVHDGTADLAGELAALPEVEGVYKPVGYEQVQPEPVGDTMQPLQDAEWGISAINADQVWDEFGVRGEDVVVASIDSGVQFDHPALVEQYRGNNGDGSFDHDYNWFDAAGSCSDAPCDHDTDFGHGTHTMGTMVGDDGGDNHIGVAPNATWIAANGCCPNDAALIASGQWLLEPTDLNGENPDAGKRPHIINNSWGSRFPSNDPFMEDVIESWAAAGIFGMFANGNSGPACETSGSPGSRTITYSTGGFDINGDVYGNSSRGPGQDGTIKPNISAPAVNVRSAHPGDTYMNLTGTSMASPHVAGTIALLWSAAPTLHGDVDATRNLLDNTAIDTEDLTCGGTAEDNNVWGEGKLDALALVQAAPVEDTGTLTGTVTDTDTGDPVDNATITITGDVDRETTTNPDGTYDTTLPAGDYTITTTAFGYQDHTTQVTITAGQTTEHNVTLEPVDNVAVRGTITDGSGHGWPLYAKITAQGTGVSDYTNPFNGRYRLNLPANGTYTLEIEPQYPGYTTTTETIDVGTTNTTHDTTITVNECETAPGYELSTTPVLAESFDDEVQPEGWSVVDNVGNGQVWAFDNPDGRSNQTGGDGGFAIADSDFFGSGGSQDTELITPVIDLADVQSPVLRFNQDFNWWSLGLDEFTNVDLSVDGGQTWENVLHQSGADVRGPRLETVGIPQAGGESEVQLRFHYGNAGFEFWWQVDNVSVVDCAPVEGGLVAGHVRDRNTTGGLNGATVTSVGNPDESATTAATPDDPQRPDGFYFMFSSLTGKQRFIASAPDYAELNRRADVAADSVVRRNYRLPAGQLEVDPTTVAAELQLGRSANRSFTITNTGTAPAQVELSESGGGFEMLDGAGTTIAATPRRSNDAHTTGLTPEGSALGGSIQADSSPKPTEAVPTPREVDGKQGWVTSGLEPGSRVTPQLASPAQDEVTITHSASQDIVSLNSVACAVTGTGLTRENGYLRKFDLDEFDIGADFDVTSVSFGIETINGPPHPVTVNLYTMADPDGEFDYGNFDPIGTTDVTLDPQELTIVDVPVEGTAPAGSTLVVEVETPDMVDQNGGLFVGSNPDGQTDPTYIRSESCGLTSPTPVEEAVPGQNMHWVLNVTGEVGGDLPWLSANPPTVTLEPGETVRANVAMDSIATDEVQPGTYTAGLTIGNDTPYQVDPVDVTMTVTPPPNWGKITGTVTGTDCDRTSSPLDQATVQINGLQFATTLFTNDNGEYNYWIGVSNNPLQTIAAKDGYIPQARTIRAIPRQTIVEDFALQAFCATTRGENRPL